MNDLERFFRHNKGRVIHKWEHYLDVYERHFARYRGTEVCVLEIGVSHGGSLDMWKEYFGPKAYIAGIDVNPACKALEGPQISIFVGDQENRDFLRNVVASMPRIDIVIDDGGHMMSQQINSFETLFPFVDANGIYVCEDLHTSYWSEFGGGYKRPGTFIEYSKDLVDRINAWHSRDQEAMPVSDFTRCVHSLHYYDSMVVIEKRPMRPPVSTHTGSVSLH